MKINKNNSGINETIHLLFSNTSLGIPKTNEIIIYPNENSWNDFGYKIRCNVRIGSIRDKDPYECEILFGFLDEKNTDLDINYYKEYKSLSSIFGDETKLRLREDIPAFFTMMPNMQAYRKIVSFYDTELSNEILLLLNDIVVKKQKNEYTDWVENAVDTKVFKLGFMRNSEPFFAYHNAESILNGLSEERFDTISSTLNLSFKLDSFVNNHNLTLKYDVDSLIPKRINILIGKNGLGKSQTLNKFCRAALRYNNDEKNLVDLNSSNGRPMINRLLAIGTPGETTTTFPIERTNSQKLYYKRLNLTRKGRTKSSRGTIELLIQIARIEEYIGDKDRWSIFIEAIKKALGFENFENIVLQLKNGSYCCLYDLKNNSVSEQKKLELWSSLDTNSEPLLASHNEYYPLSSGQLTFFKFALLASLFIENGSFVLMDEPETHLHPNLISDFIDLLDFLLEKTGSYALLATHSAYLVREVSREQVHVYKVDKEKNISIVPPRLRTFGANIDQISEFVFGDDIENRLTDKIINRVSKRSFESIDEEIGHEISLPSLMAIKRRIKKNN